MPCASAVSFSTLPLIWTKPGHSRTLDWAQRWHEDHAALQRRVGKPVICEGYGWLSPEQRLEQFGTVSNHTRLEVIGSWQKTFYEEKIAEDSYWLVPFSRFVPRLEAD